MRAFGFVLVAAVLFCPSGALYAQSQRMAYINSQAILEVAPGASEAQEEFDRQMANWTSELQAMSVEIDSLMTRYQQQQGALLPNVREAREAEIQQKDQRYQARMSELEQESQAIRQRLMQPILEVITSEIEAMRAEGGYALIFDSAGQSIVAADPALDLTDEVISRLQRAGPPAPAPTTGTP